MAKSLQEQLMKSGLIDKKKAKKIKTAQRISKRDQSEKLNEDKLHAQEALRAKTERDKELNRIKNKKAEERAILAQIKQLIQSNKIDHGDGELTYQFSDSKNIKKIYINEALQTQLIKGLIAIVKHDDNYSLVPRVIAEKVSQRDPAFVIVLNSNETEEIDENDPYADYKIPDDLMW